MTVNGRLHELNLVGESEAVRAAEHVEKLEEILVCARVDRPSIHAMVDALCNGWLMSSRS